MSPAFNVFLLLLGTVSAENLRGHGCSDPVPAEMANSEMIEGHDCGQVKRIFAKWKKSADVGKLGGKARNVVIGADKAAEMALAAKDKAEAAADAAEAVGGAAANGAAQDARDAADKAKDASDDASSASSTLDSSLDEMKSDAGKTPWNSATGKMNAVKKDKEDTEDATKTAIKATQVALKMAQDATKVALSSADNALKMVEKLSEDSLKATDLAAETNKEAGFAVRECEGILGGADVVIEKLNDKINEDKGSQGPVFEAYKDKLQKAYTSAENAKEDLKSEIPKLSLAADETKEATVPIDDKKAEMAGGAGDPRGMGEMASDMSTLDTKLKKLAEITDKVEAMTKDVDNKKKRVTKLGKEAEEFKIDWAPPANKGKN